jgi:hypothetical protein
MVIAEPPAPASLSTAPLRALLERCASGLGDETIAAARCAGAEAAGDVVAELLRAELSRPRANGAAIRAAHLAGELGLTSAIPALVRCLERLPEPHPLRDAAVAAIARLGTPAVDAVLAWFDRGSTPEARARAAVALSAMGVEDDRIRAAFVRMLEDDPVRGAQCLAGRGEWRAVADLGRALDRFLRDPIGDCDVCSSEHLVAIASAIAVLGGTLSVEQRAKMDAVLKRAEAMWIRFEDPRAPAAGALHRRAAPDSRPGRNDPCHCGSGKKYKRCHLEADQHATH